MKTLQKLPKSTLSIAEGGPGRVQLTPTLSIPPDTPIRALSWKQPFASLMLHGKIETRVWSTDYRGWVLICASKKEYTDDELEDIIPPYGIIRIINTLSPLNIEETCGKAIAIGRLVDCYPMRVHHAKKCFVKYSPGLYCHVYDSVIPIEPFPWKGLQGWCTLTPNQRAMIKPLQ